MMRSLSIRVITFISFISLSACSSLQVNRQGQPAVVAKKELSVLIVYGNGVSIPAARESFASASKHLESIFDVALRSPREVYARRSPVEETPAQKIYSWKKHLASHLDSKYDVVYLFLPRQDIYAADGGLVLGYAQGIDIVGKIPNALAYSVVTGNSNWDSQMIFHEVGHLLGAKHSHQGVMKAKNWTPALAGTIAVEHEQDNHSHDHNSRASFPFQSAPKQLKK